MTRTCQLGGSSTKQRDKAGSVDDGSTSMQAFLWVGSVLSHSDDGVFATPPNTFQVDLHREVPNLLLGVECVVVCGVHNT